MSTGLRRRARIVAVQTLYELEFAASREDNILGRNLKEKEISGDVANFTVTLVNGVTSNKQQLDDIISRFAKAFPVNQLAVTDRNILRLALFEIIIDKSAPPKVVINEAVELAKMFGTDKSPKFINGVLGSVISGIQKKTSELD